MSAEETTVQEIETPDELASLKARADQLGVSYHPNIGLEKLRDKVNAALSEDEPEQESAPVTEDVNARKARLRREASALVRVRVTCMNPNKTEWEGEVFTCGNTTVGTFKKYVPFNSDEGYHIPKILLNMLTERQCQVFQTVTDRRGNKTRKGKLIKEFAIEVMPPLTKEELHDLAQRQAMAKSID